MIPGLFADNKALHRFEWQVEGSVAFLDYRQVSNHLTLIHTETPEALRGKGIGGALVERVFRLADQEGWRVIPVCPFVKAYLDKHPEWAHLLKGRNHL